MPASLALGQKEGWLGSEDIENFPCEDLRTINQLWLDYSDGKFGFSVMKEIYESRVGTLAGRSGTLAGRSDSPWGSDSEGSGDWEIIRKLAAGKPSGFLPGGVWYTDGQFTPTPIQLAIVMETLFSRAKNCDL